jgi:dTDP-4-dehydrorhamnose reductase
MAPGLLVFGAGSLVGSDFVVRATERFPITAAGRTDPRTDGWPVRRFQALDLSSESDLRAFLAARTEDVAWVNFAARTDVDGCEAERPAGPFESAAVDRPGSAWRLNAAAPGWIAEEAQRRGVPFLHVSTDFVFDGKAGPYAEAAEPAPFDPSVSWYGYTKGVGERRVLAADPAAAIVRISYPYRTSFRAKTDFARNLLDRGQTGRLYPLFDDQVVTPTWIPDVGASLLAILDARASGVFHVASPEATTPLAFAQELFRVFRVETGPLSVAKIAAQGPGPGRAARPRLGGLKVGRVVGLGVTPTGYRDAIVRMAAAQESPP